MFCFLWMKLCWRGTLCQTLRSLSGCLPSYGHHILRYTTRVSSRTNWFLETPIIVETTTEAVLRRFFCLLSVSLWTDFITAMPHKTCWDQHEGPNRRNQFVQYWVNRKYRILVFQIFLFTKYSSVILKLDNRRYFWNHGTNEIERNGKVEGQR